MDEQINFENDPLLLNKHIFVDGSFNIYGNKKGEILKRCPYVCDKNNEIFNLIHSISDYNYINLRDVLKDYLNIKRIRKDTISNWLNKKIYPFPLVSVISLLTGKNILKILNGKYITNYCQTSKIKFPCSYKIISSNFMAYFVGLHFGDGTLSEEKWKIVDGDSSLDGLKYSKEFLEKIKGKLSNLFDTDSFKIYPIKDKNAYELVIPSKWFSRYLNFVYNLEFGEKQNFYFSSFFKNRKYLILRGLFDTDGSIDSYRISFATKYYDLYKKVSYVLNKYDLLYYLNINNISRENKLYDIRIDSKSNLEFIDKIGFSHPRKAIRICTYLSTHSISKYFLSYNPSYKPNIPEKDFIELCSFLRPIQGHGKINFFSIR